MKYLFVLDFGDGKVWRYTGWNPDNESIEDFIIDKGHSLSNIEWMATDIGKLYTYMDAD